MDTNCQYILMLLKLPDQEELDFFLCTGLM